MFSKLILLFAALPLFAQQDYSASLYAKRNITGTNYLAFRDIPALVSNCFPENEKLAVVDYGCGTGRSTRFIRNVVPQGSTVIGIDISSDMLQQAIQLDPTGTYLKMDKEIPFPDETFDFVYSNFVLFELESREEIVRVITEIARTMKEGAFLITTTGAAPMYDRNNHWATLDPNFPQNDSPVSGSIVRIKALIPGGGTITFDDYFWTEKDYEECFSQAGLSLVSVHHPLGKPDERIDWEWRDEVKVSPYVTFVLKKLPNLI